MVMGDSAEMLGGAHPESQSGKPKAGGVRSRA